MKRRSYTEPEPGPSIEVITRMLRTRGLEPDVRADLERKLDDRRREAGLAPINRLIPPYVAPIPVNKPQKVTFGQKILRRIRS